MQRRWMLSLLCLAVALVPAYGAVAQEEAGDQQVNDRGETPQEFDKRMEWWRDARFGMFIHWGIYSVPAGTYDGKRIGGIGEWIMNNASIPVAEYAAYADDFNPVKFDAQEWVSLAKRAGMKYMVITAKHHDGFAMFDSDVSDFNIVDATPYDKDPIRLLAEECRRQGLRFGVYYSQAQDWSHPGGAAYRTGGRDSDHWDPAQEGSYDEYIDEVAAPQVRELLTDYGPLDILWWDTPKDTTREQAARLNELLGLQPQIITNNRLGGGFQGDTETPEQHIPARGFPDGRDWETCMTLNDTWGYKSYDDNWKSTTTLIHNLVDIVSKGGNYLLNVGPTAEGVIPTESQERLREVGDWLSVNGEAIYGAQASCFERLPWGRCTTKPLQDGQTAIYLHVFEWPEDGRLVAPGLMNEVVSVTGLHRDRMRRVAGAEKTDGGVEVKLLGKAWNPHASVIKLVVEGAPKVDPSVALAAMRVHADDKGTLAMGAQDAQILGAAQLENKYGEPSIGYWTSADSKLQFYGNLKRSGKYLVTLTYSCDPSFAGSEVAIRIGDESLTTKIDGTGGWGEFEAKDLGELELKAGDIEVMIEPQSMPRSAVMNFRALRLTPEE